MNIKMNKLHGSRSRRRQRRRAWIPGVVGLVTHHSGQLLLRGRVFPHFHDEGARARSLWAGTGLLAVWVQSSSASRGRLQSPSPVHREPTLLAVLPTKARLAQAEGLPSIGEMALPLVTLEGRAGVGVILVITRGPAIAFCTLAHVRGPSWHTFPAVAAVGRGQNEKGEGRALQRFSLSTTAKPRLRAGLVGLLRPIVCPLLAQGLSSSIDLLEAQIAPCQMPAVATRLAGLPTPLSK